MTATEDVVDFVRSTTPPPAARESATAELARFAEAGRAGAESSAVRALRAALGTAEAGPVRTAWVSATAAGAGAEAGADGDGGPEWIAVCAAAGALEADPARAAEATALGYAVAEHIATALGTAHTDAGWAAQCTAGAIGAAAAAGRLLALGALPTRHLLGLAATQAAGLAGARGTDAWALQLGKTAANAVEAALLAGNGFTSSAEPLEGRRGLFALMSPGARPPRDRLGAHWN
ncbi:MmgE/PrpD family protein [Streptomyces sp. TS71-3]|uniref:MmgE/PrpD family protein n=1 Tax=Streptomyces sp. TS71-3 TaxID=2733862 RepID=UPI001B0BAC70|nr:MmgE/PrpD family protein [Streptomyces sp. TS71-3]GHJ41567.1 hypothetical protein Sm713_71760 [Streptomyces sp. TS71-3]